jgi:hypothetical protein
MQADMHSLFTMPTIADFATMIGKSAPPGDINVAPNHLFKPCEQEVENFNEMEGTL